MSTTNILDLNNRIDALEKISHNVEPIQQQLDELKAWTDSGTKDASGNPIILTDGAAFNAEGLVVTCNPKQNLHGYDHPWAGGAGKNKLDVSDCIGTQDGKTFSLSDDLGITVSGSASGGVYRPANANVALTPSTNYAVNGMSADIKLRFQLYDSNNTMTRELYATNVDLSFTTTADEVKAVVFIIVSNNANGTVHPMLRLASVSDATFAPYSNECPITGYTECGVEVKDEEETTHDTATITFGQTVYGGSVDFKTGKVTVTHASIASYNGETINEPWLSSIDEYVSGTTPTTGAQVVYPLTTPIELTLTPAELELLKGYNYITTNGTTIELTYQPDTLKADILLTVSQLYGSKISIFDGILAGGDTGQVLTKTSDDDYDATWETLPATRTTTKKSEK